MSLSGEWFDERGNRMRVLEDNGCTDLSAFLKAHSHTVERFEAAGVLQGKNVVSTAELWEHVPTVAGKAYLRYYTVYDFLLVKKGRSAALLSAVREWLTA